MDSRDECKCCQSIDETRAMAAEEGTKCIVQHPGFEPVCLNPHVLRAAYNRFKERYQTQLDDENK
jgi:hypothetical protein